MPGLIFLFSIWLIWIVVTFWMKKTNEFRFPIAAIILLLIILMPVHFDINRITISGSAIFLLLLCYIIMTRLPFRKQLYLLFSIIAVMIGFAGLQLLELYDPVWMMLDRRIVYSFLFFVTSYFLFTNAILSRFLLIYTSLLQGELLYALILSKWQIQYLVGAMETFDLLAFITLVLLVEYMVRRLQHYIRWNKNKKMIY